MEDPIVIPTSKSVLKTLRKTSQKIQQVNPAAKVLVTTDNSGGLGVVASSSAQSVRLQAEVNEKIAVWQSNRIRQSSLLTSLEELLNADLEALKAGKRPPS